MPTPEEQYDLLLRQGAPSSSEPEESLGRIGLLVDLASERRDVIGLEKAISWSEALSGFSLSEGQRARLHYFTGNAWSDVDRLKHGESETKWRWERSEMEQEILHFRLAMSPAGASSLDVRTRCQVHTNLGNALSKIGRFVEAQNSWGSALSLDPEFAMATANRGYGLFSYARELFDPGHAALFVQSCCVDLAQAEEGELEPGVWQSLKQSLDQARAVAERMGVSDKPEFREFPLGDSPEEVSYRRWCLKHRLFINPLNDLGKHSIAAADVLHLPSMTLGIDESPSLLGFYNQLKQEYVSARFMYYQGVTSYDPHYSDRDVTQINTLDYPAYSLAVEMVKAGFRTAYSILDKLAFFFNDYLGLGIPSHRTSLRSFWYVDQRRKDGLRPEFVERANWPLRGLYWLSKDLAENRPGFRKAMSPDAQGIASIRNHLEHKYLKLHQESWVAAHGEVSREGEFSMDTLAKSLDRTDFEAMTLRLFKLARAALIYTSLAVHSEERRKGKERDKETVVGPMITDRWNDEWKQ